MGKAKRMRQLKKIQARREHRTKALNVGALETLDAVPVADRPRRRAWERGELRRAPIWPGRYLRAGGRCPQCRHTLWQTSQGEKRLYCQGCGWR